MTRICESFVEVFKFPQFVITTFMTTAELQRRFPAFKRIKTFIKISMEQNRLTDLAILSMYVKKRIS